jgi:hypothetical protein
LTFQVGLLLLHVTLVTTGDRCHGSIRVHAQVYRSSANIIIIIVCRFLFWYS